MADVAATASSLSVGRSHSQPAQARVTAAPARPLPAGYTHLGVAKEIVPTLREFGLDPDPIIQASGLSPCLFDDGASMIPHVALGRLCGLSVARTNCPHFGLLVGRRATILSLGLVGRLMLHCETFGAALRSLVTHLSVQDRVVVPLLEVDDDTAVFSFAVYQPGTRSADQIIDGALACMVNAMRTLLGEGWTPAEVLLPHATPVNQEPYRRHFRAPVRFDQEIAALVFPASVLGRPIPGADPVMRALLEERIRQIKGVSQSEFTDDIRRLLRTRLTGHGCSVDSLANLLAMHRRTLSRRLKSTGKGYRALASETKFEMARQLLEDTRVPLGEITAALGFSEASAFTRAFRRWSGKTPSAWRATHRRAGTPDVPMSELDPTWSKAGTGTALAR
jgi:AraC-like DNA-binding protein